MSNNNSLQGQSESPTLSDEDRAALRVLLGKPQIDDLYAELARDALGAGAMGEDPVGNGKRLFERALSRVRERICGHARVRSLAERTDADSADGMACAAVVASIVAGSIGTSLHVLLVVALVLRIGLRKVCDPQWRP
jgi:hypothetical protein